MFRGRFWEASTIACSGTACSSHTYVTAADRPLSSVHSVTSVASQMMHRGIVIFMEQILSRWM